MFTFRRRLKFLEERVNDLERKVQNLLRIMQEEQGSFVNSRKADDTLQSIDDTLKRIETVRQFNRNEGIDVDEVTRQIQKQIQTQFSKFVG